ncbi:MAG: MBL fold metallo-hydrolase [Candidatus Margulisiibacteriota bacterium]
MNFIKFLGTAGARIVVAKQVRASGGIWLSLDGTNILIDPGPGSLVRCVSSKPKLDPAKLEGIVLSHKHLDHSADVNVMMEAMTLGGHDKKGVVLAPKDALEGEDPVIFKYVRSYVDKIEILKEKGNYKIGNIEIYAPVKHIHGVETYGLIFKGKKHTISYIADTKFFPELSKKYQDDILIISVLRPEPSPLDHLCLEDAKKIIKEIKPKVAILTHFGMWMIQRQPWQIAEQLSQELKTRVVAASDGMNFKLNH